MWRKMVLGSLILCLGLPFVLIWPVTAQSTPILIPLPVAGAGTHPRLLISASYLDETIRPRILQERSAWQGMLAYVESEAFWADFALYPEEAAKTLGLIWLVTENRDYYSQAVGVALELVNAIDASALVQMINGKWDERLLQDVAALALAYDWLYGLFSADDRAIIADVLIRAGQRLQNPANDSGRVWLSAADLAPEGDATHYMVQAFNSESALWAWALTATGLALQGEYIGASAFLETSRAAWTQFLLPALAVQANGAWAAGPVDGFKAGWWLVQTATAWWTARGDDYFSGLEWWAQRLGYQVSMRYPAAQNSLTQGEAILGYPAIIGDGERHSYTAVYGHTQEMLLARIFTENPYAAWANWVHQHIELPLWARVEAFLWQDDSALGQVPDGLTWRSFGTNHVFMRSGWADESGLLDQNAVVVTYQAGDHYAARQFFDQGNLTIWYRGSELLTRGGVYSGTGDSAHDANYYGRTVGGNSVLVCDLAEIFDHIRPNQETGIWLNDCGQRALDDNGLAAVNVEYLQANRSRFDTANFNLMLDSPQVTYIQSDLTGAYNSTGYVSAGNQPKVENVLRELVYIRPNTVIVYDRVRTLSPDFTALQTFHFNTRPQFDGVRWTVTEGEAALYLQHLVPEAQMRPVDGYITAGQLIATPLEQARVGWYRLDIYPPAATATNWFLSTLTVGDAAAPPPLPGVLVLVDGMRGVVVSSALERWQVMFDDDPNAISQTQFSVEAGIQHLLITGLVGERVYRLEWADGRVEERISHGAGTILVDNPTPSLVRVSLAG